MANFKKGDFVKPSRRCAKYLEDAYDRDVNIGVRWVFNGLTADWVDTYKVNRIDVHGKFIGELRTQGYNNGVQKEYLVICDGLVNATGNSVDLFNNEIDRLNNKIAEIERTRDLLQEKVDFMVSNNLDTFDETVFKSYRILRVLEEREDLTDLERAQLVSEIVNG